jgi:hypothetical protein
VQQIFSTLIFKADFYTCLVQKIAGKICRFTKLFTPENIKYLRVVNFDVCFFRNFAIVTVCIKNLCVPYEVGSKSPVTRKLSHTAIVVHSKLNR